jgi:hypothetical protein
VLVEIAWYACAWQRLSNATFTVVAFELTSLAVGATVQDNGEVGGSLEVDAARHEETGVEQGTVAHRNHLLSGVRGTSRPVRQPVGWSVCQPVRLGLLHLKAASQCCLHTTTRIPINHTTFPGSALSPAQTTQVKTTRAAPSIQASPTGHSDRAATPPTSTKVRSPTCSGPELTDCWATTATMSRDAANAVRIIAGNSMKGEACRCWGWTFAVFRCDPIRRPRDQRGLVLELVQRE